MRSRTSAFASATLTARDSRTRDGLPIGSGSVSGRHNFAIRYVGTCRSTGQPGNTGSPTDDIEHVVEHALVAAEDDAGKCLYLGPNIAGNLLEVVSVVRDDGDEVVIHAMPMRKAYESLLFETGED